MALWGNTKSSILFKLGLLTLAAVYSLGLFSGGPVSAAQLTSRSLTLGSSAVSASTTHLFGFTIATTGNVGSIIFDYCTTASGTCTAPTGLDVDSVTLSNQTGATGFVVDGTQTDTNTIVIDRSPSSVSSSTAVTYTFSSAVNPSATNTTFYTRISTTTAVDGGGSTVDTGAVAASTATQIVLTGYMPESLVFCTGGTVSLTGGGLPDCSTATSGSVSLPDFSPTSVSSAISQMAASTNASAGYSITVSGPTLTSGSNTIAAIGGTAQTSQIGKIGGQFGLNLKDNAAPDTGSEVTPTTNGTNYKGQAKSPFATADNFAFTAGSAQQVAASDNGGAGPTDSQRFTVTYIVNVSGAQPVGSYTSTLTYICTPTF